LGHSKELVLKALDGLVRLMKKKAEDTKMQIFRSFCYVHRLSEMENGKANNLNLLRFLLASAVILSHCYLLLGLGNLEPMYALVGYTDLGRSAVFGFFFISGYLIVKSAFRWSGPEQYIASRVLRIFPGLAVVILLCAFVLGPLATTLPLREYLLSPVTYSFLTQIWMHHTQLSLPGVFSDGRTYSMVNGSLWTLPVEWTLYMLTMLVCLMARWRSLATHLSARTWTVIFVSLALTLQMMPLRWDLAWGWSKVFFMGAMCYLLRKWVPLSLPFAIFILCLDVYLMQSGSKMSYHLFPYVLGYFVLTLGYHPAVHVAGFHRFGDYSYGLYIYAYPLQQFLVTRFHNPLAFFAVVYPLTLLAAVCSWHFIEGPSLKLKYKIERTLKPETAEAEVSV
jgi:peptidoglycan/LPS O-acetylase OafA/YrhL